MRAVRRTPRTKTKKGNKKRKKQRKKKKQERKTRYDTIISHQRRKKTGHRHQEHNDGHHTTAKTTPQNSITSRGGTGFPCKKPGFGMVSMPGRRDTPFMGDAYPIRKGRWKERRA